MTTTDAFAIAVALGGLAAIIVETALKDSGAFREIATDVEAFARRPAPLATAPVARSGVYVAGAVTTVALLVLLA